MLTLEIPHLLKACVDQLLLQVLLGTAGRAGPAGPAVLLETEGQFHLRLLRQPLHPVPHRQQVPSQVGGAQLEVV